MGRLWHCAVSLRSDACKALNPCPRVHPACGRRPRGVLGRPRAIHRRIEGAGTTSASFKRKNDGKRWRGWRALQLHKAVARVDSTHDAYGNPDDWAWLRLSPKIRFFIGRCLKDVSAGRPPLARSISPMGGQRFVANQCRNYRWKTPRPPSQRRSQSHPAAFAATNAKQIRYFGLISDDYTRVLAKPPRYTSI